MAELEELMAPGNFTSLKKHLTELNTVDLANELDELEDLTKVVFVLRMLPKDRAAEIFAYLDSDRQRMLAEAITMPELHDLINEMSVDDAVDFLEELPSNMVRTILNNADPGKRNVINRFLNYPENSAGSIMTVEFVGLYEDITCQAALDLIRDAAIDKETIYTCYVTDASRHLTGAVSLKNILLAEEKTLIRDLMNPQVISVGTHEDQEVAAKLFQKYDLIAMPVTDSENRIVGMITIDDIIDVIEAENTEDVQKMAAVRPSEYEYLDTGVLRLAGNRIPWLLIMMFSASLAEYLVKYFDAHLPTGAITMLAMTAFIPMLMDTGGNCGAQSSTLIIRGLAINEIELKDWMSVLGREVRIALLVGFFLAGVNLLRVLLLGCFHSPFAWPEPVDYLVSVTLIFVVLAAKMIGCCLPMLAKFCHIDPAMMATPMVATIVDVVSLLIYFGTATFVLSL